MANFRTVNRSIMNSFPDSGIVVVRGPGYVYFNDPEIEAIMTHPTSTSTGDVIRLCIDVISDHVLTPAIR